MYRQRAERSFDIISRPNGTRQFPYGKFFILSLFLGQEVLVQYCDLAEFSGYEKEILCRYVKIDLEEKEEKEVKKKKKKIVGPI